MDHGPTETITGNSYLTLGFDRNTRSYTAWASQCMFDKPSRNAVSYLCSNSWEFEGLEGLVIDGGTRVDIDHHAGHSSATKVTLQDAGQFAVSEWHHLRGAAPGVFREIVIQLNFTGIKTHTFNIKHILILVVPQGSDAAPQRQEGGVDVGGLLHPLTVSLLFAALWPGQVTHGQPGEETARTSMLLLVEMQVLKF